MSEPKQNPALDPQHHSGWGPEPWDRYVRHLDITILISTVAKLEEEHPGCDCPPTVAMKERILRNLCGGD